jgi:hypothetical protein
MNHLFLDGPLVGSWTTSFITATAKLRLFGEVIDTYDMTQAVADKAIARA